MGNCTRGLVWAILLSCTGTLYADIVENHRPIALRPPAPQYSGRVRFPGDAHHDEQPRIAYLAGVTPPAGAEVMGLADPHVPDPGAELSRLLRDAPADVLRHVVRSGDEEAERHRRAERQRARVEKTLELERTKAKRMATYALKVAVGVVLGWLLWFVVQRS